MLIRTLGLFFLLFSPVINSSEVPSVLVSDSHFKSAWELRQETLPGHYFEQLTAAAGAGDIAATWRLIHLYLNKEQQLYNPILAEKLLLRLAQRERPEALFLLAKLYLLPPFSNEEKSVQLLDKLTLQNWLPAFLMLAKLRPELSVGLWEKAANLGNAEAQFELGKFLHETTSSIEAREWLIRSANQSYLPAVLLLADVSYEKREFAEAVMWRSKAVSRGDRSAVKPLAVMHMKGEGVAISVVNAVELLLRHGYDDLVSLSFLASEVSYDPIDKALDQRIRKMLDSRKYKQVLKQADGRFDLSAEVLFRIGYLYKSGVSSVNYRVAREYYYRSALLGYLPAYNSLGVLYEKGMGVSRSLDGAEAYYRFAADLGYEKSAINLTELLLMRVR